MRLASIAIGKDAQLHGRNQIEVQSQPFNEKVKVTERKQLVLVVIFVTMTHSRVGWEEGTSDERMPPSDWLVNKSAGQCFD